MPVTRGCDKLFTLERRDADGVPQDYESGSEVYMWVDVDRDDPTRVDAVVSGSQAAFAIQSELLDQVRNGMRWRIVLDVGSVEIPLLVGRFERRDG